MENTDLRDSLVHQADTAMLSLLRHVNILLETTHIWAARNPAITKMDKLKHRELKSAVFDLGSIPKMLVGEIARWKKGEERVLSTFGTETMLLNELYANMESMLWFFTREQVDVPGFSLEAVKIAYAELLRCNRLL